MGGRGLIALVIVYYGGVYKDYVLVMLFYKYLSDLSKRQYDKYKERFGKDEARIKEKMKTDRFYLPPGTSFDEIYQKKELDNIGEVVNKALHKIEDLIIKPSWRICFLIWILIPRRFSANWNSAIRCLGI